MKKRKDKRKKKGRQPKSYVGLKVLKGKGLRASECFQCKRQLLKRQKRVEVKFVQAGNRYVCLKCGKALMQRRIDNLKSNMAELKKELRKIRDGDLVMEAL